MGGLTVDLRGHRPGRSDAVDAWLATVAPLLGVSQPDADVLVCPLRPLEPAPPGMRRLPVAFSEADAAAEPGAVVAPPGPRPDFHAEGDESRFAGLGLPDGYLLSTLEPGHELLLDLLASDPELPALVLLSPTLARAAAFRARAEALGVGERLRLAGAPPRGALPLLLRRSRAVVHVSGETRFPVLALDALAAGVPLITAPGTPAAALGESQARLAEDASAAALARELAGTRPRAPVEFLPERSAEAVREAAERLRSRPPAVTSEPPTLSVVTPSLNMARFLRDTVDSVLAQDYPRLEYLVMDGGSTDGTVDLLRSYGDRLRFVSGPDGGQADAVNRGFRATSGALFAFLNADDTYRPGAAARAVRAFLDRPEAAVVYGDGVHVDEQGHELAPYPTLDFDPEALGRRCFICQPAAFMSRSAVERVGLLDPSLHVALDYDLWIRLAKHYPFARVPGVLAASRMHAQNKTLAERRVAYREGVELLKRHYGYVPLEWLHAQAQFLVEGVDQFFTHSRPSARSRALALALGVRHNPGQLGRVMREWAVDAGLRDHDGRWEDGWISRRFVDEVDVPDDCSEIRVNARHEAWMQTPLEVSLHLDGRLVTAVRPAERGPFSIEAPCPPDVRGRRARLEIAASRTWRPLSRGDRRRVSCVVDSIDLD